MSDFKAELKELGDKMHDLATRADGLQNKHLRDIITLGLGRFKDALGHPDIDLLVDDGAAPQHDPGPLGAAPQHDPGLTSDAARQARQARADGKPFPG